VTWATLDLQNAGSAPWREDRIRVSYHWLDQLGNPIVWDGYRTPIECEPGAGVEFRVPLRGPVPPGPYRLAFDLVDEAHLWFSEVGGAQLAVDATVGPRIERRALAVTGADPGVLLGQEAIAAPEEAVAVAHLAPGCEPAPDWSSRILDAHEQGYGLVGGAVDAGRGQRERLTPWAPGTGRHPSFPEPLLCPSIVGEVVGAELAELHGLPAIGEVADEPRLYDGRIVVRARLPAGRRHG
jgi:hypothetical protein